MNKKPVCWEAAASAADNARRRLPALAKSYFKRGREVVDGESTLAELHALRLATKRFRYTLEIFRPVYGPALERRLDAVRRIQQSLGELNDRVSTGDLLRSAPYREMPEAQALLPVLERDAQARAEAFRRSWREEFDAPGQLEAWIRYLRLYAGRRHAQRRPARRTRRRGRLL